jgi:hypothetical protein
MTDTTDKLAEALEKIQKEDWFWTSREYLTAQSIVVEDDRKHHSVKVLGNCGKMAHAALAAHREAKAQPHDPLPQNCVHGVSDENGNVIDCGEPLPCKYHDKAQPQEPGEFDALVEEANRHIKLRLLKGDLKSKLIEAITTLQARVREASEAAKGAWRNVEQAEQMVLAMEGQEHATVKLIDSIFPNEIGGGMQRVVCGIKALKDQADEARAKALEEAANKVKQLIVYDDTGESADKARFGAVEAIIALTPARREEG